MQCKINTITIKPSHSTVKRKTMMNIYFDDGVQPAFFVHACSTIEEAKKWIREQLKDYIVVDDNHKCTEDVMGTSQTALYEVFNGEPITMGEDGEPNLAEPIYESEYFYTDHYAFE